MSGPLDKEVKKELNGKKSKKDPFDEILCDLDEYQEGCEPRNLTDSGE